MDVCPYYANLAARVVTLEQKFLTQQLNAELADPLSFQPDTDFLAAYRLLVHAEIEDFLERRGRAELDIKEQQLKDKRIDIPVFWAYQLGNHFGIHLPHDCPFDDKKFRDAIGLIIKTARDVLSDNNGIKTSIYVTVGLICGFSTVAIDSSLAAMLSSYGEARGDVAHKSTKRVTTIRAPSAEKHEVDEIIRAVARFFSPGSVVPVAPNPGLQLGVTAPGPSSERPSDNNA
jgi:hypothetical protein